MNKIQVNETILARISYPETSDVGICFFGSTTMDTHNSYNKSTGEFTAVSDGTVYFTITMREWSGTTTLVDVDMFINKDSIKKDRFDFHGQLTQTIFKDNIKAGDRISLRINGKEICVGYIEYQLVPTKAEIEVKSDRPWNELKEYGFMDYNTQSLYKRVTTLKDRLAGRVGMDTNDLIVDLATAVVQLMEVIDQEDKTKELTSTHRK